MSGVFARSLRESRGVSYGGYCSYCYTGACDDNVVVDLFIDDSADSTSKAVDKARSIEKF